MMGGGPFGGGGMHARPGAAEWTEKSGEKKAGFGQVAAHNEAPAGEAGLEDKLRYTGHFDPALMRLGALMALGSSRQLVDEDLGTLPPSASRTFLQTRFDSAWAEERKRDMKDQRLWRVILKTLGPWNCIISTILLLMGGGSGFAQPLLLKAISNALLMGGMPESELWILIALAFVIPILASILKAQSDLIYAYMGIQIRNLLSSVIFHKILSRRHSDLDTGFIINLVNVDAKSLEQAFSIVSQFILIPSILIVALALIYQEVGVSMFIGIAFTVVVAPIAATLFSFAMGLFRQRMARADARLKLVNEIFTGIRVLKYYAWEYAFMDMVEAVRSEEVALSLKISHFFAFGMYFNNCIPALLPVVIFSAYIGLGNQLDAVKAFVTIQYLQLLAAPIQGLSGIVNQIAYVTTASGRILKYLNEPDLDKYVQSEATTPGTPGEEDVVVKFNDASLGWTSEERLKQDAIRAAEAAKSGGRGGRGRGGRGDGGRGRGGGRGDGGRGGRGGGSSNTKEIEMAKKQADKKVEGQVESKNGDLKPGDGAESISVVPAGVNRSIQTLQNISLSVKRGQLVAIVGQIGSGKSSLLSALLNELLLQSGSVTLKGSTSYHQQNPWIFNDTLKNNILFGQPFDENRFNEVIRVASLGADIKALPDGIHTEIGEKGINLSGGQKARVSFARSLYHDCDVYLFDDPLSAVDVHVGNTLFHQGIRSFLRGKTVLLCTHQVQFLKDCDVIVVMEDGKIKTQGSYEDLSKSGVDINAIVPSKQSNGQDADSESSASAIDGEGADVTANAAVAVAVAATTKDTITPHKDTSESESNSTQNDGNKGQGPTDTAHVADVADVADVSVNVQTAEKDGETKKEEAGETGPESDKDKDSKEKEKPMAVAVSASTPASASTSKEPSASNDDGKDSKDSNDKDSNDKDSNDKDSKDAKKLMTEEHRHKGTIRWNVYWFYISNGLPVLYLAIVVISLGSQVMQTYANIWLSNWGIASRVAEARGSPLTLQGNLAYLGTYAGLVIGGSFSQLLSLLINFRHRIRASIRIHRRLMDRILHAPISFFDTTPLGRLMNVFSNDVRTVDMMVGMSLAMSITFFCTITGNVGLLAYTTRGTFLLALLPLFALYSYFQTYYQATNLQLKRLDSIALSPIVSHFSETLHGVTSARAFNMGANLEMSVEENVMRESNIFYLIALVNSWKSIRLDMIGASMSFFVYTLTALTLKEQFIPVGMMLVAINYSQLLPGLLSQYVTIISNTETSMNSVERIMQYALDTDVEPDVYVKDADASSHGAAGGVETRDRSSSNSYIESGITTAVASVPVTVPAKRRSRSGSRSELLSIEDNATNIPDNWPDKGIIEVKNAVMGYREGPAVLKGLSFSTKEHEKVGVVGRTGCGKSSLMLSLYRFENLREGQILIDGIDIATVPLPILRSRLGIVPQDSMLWNTTLRKNMDPFSQFTDEEVWASLDSVCLKEKVMSLPDKLLHDVKEGGANFSAGEKQLLCFARCILKKTKVLIMDEATASVDNETDVIIQKMIREKFADCTVLTIAHRLNTIIDADRLLVMSDGRLVEFDSPQNLLQINGGLFAGMWRDFEQSHSDATQPAH